MLDLVIITIAGFLAAVAITPVVRRIAIRFEIVDRPDPHRKLHQRVVARAGGTVILASVSLVCLLAILGYDFRSLETAQFMPFLGLFSAMIAIWLLGLADDVWTLRGRQKLVAQTIIAFLLVLSGFQIRGISLMGASLDLGMMSIPISVIWLLATTNALNLIDGADGLCSTLGAIICGALGVLAFVNGHFAEAAIAFALCGSLLGFLVYNFPPASIFLGDSGSLLVGMVAGALSIRCALKGPASVAFLAPAAILFLPLLDSTMAVLRRKLTGRSIYTTDRAHIHHTLKNRGLGDRGLLLVVACLATITASGALLSQFLGRDWIASISVVVVFLLLVITKAFGHAELVLIARRSTHFLASLTQPVQRTEPMILERYVRLQGNRRWETVWATLVEFADREQLCKVHMDLNVPWLEEGFHGSWQRSSPSDRATRWTTSLPIRASGQVAGRLDVIGESASISAIPRLVELLEDLTPQVESLLLPLAESVHSGKISAEELFELASTN